MNRPPSFVLAALLVVVPAASPALATSITYFASLSGANESPANGSPGAGTVSVTIDDSVQSLRIDTTFSGLIGTTTASHIHCCTTTPFTANAGVAVTPVTLPGFPLGVTSGTYLAVLDLTNPANFTSSFVTNFGGGTLAGAQLALWNGLAGGKAYFNIHSNVYPGGEIRGFLQPVPDDTDSLLLLGTSVAGLFGFALRRRVV